GTERKREENQRRHPRPRQEAVRCHEPAHERYAADGQPRLADHPQHTFRALAHGSGQLPVVVEDGGADSLL
ncbi:nuclease, partial [Salmonella enterica subsp. enterica serovar Enteritidis]|nr:nuclease [Salmonella enterica subsp. enterica serovar Enteritidis]